MEGLQTRCSGSNRDEEAGTRAHLPSDLSRLSNAERNHPEEFPHRRFVEGVCDDSHDRWQRADGRPVSRG